MEPSSFSLLSHIIIDGQANVTKRSRISGFQRRPCTSSHLNLWAHQALPQTPQPSENQWARTLLSSIKCILDRRVFFRRSLTRRATSRLPDICRTTRRRELAWWWLLISCTVRLTGLHSALSERSVIGTLDQTSRARPPMCTRSRHSSKRVKLSSMQRQNPPAETCVESSAVTAPPPAWLAERGSRDWLLQQPPLFSSFRC